VGDGESACFGRRKRLHTVAMLRTVKPKTERPYPDSFWLWAAAVNLLLALAFLLFFVVVSYLAVYSQAAHAFDITWDKKKDDSPPLIVQEPPPEREKAPPPPDIQPFEIPTLKGNKRDFHYIPPVKLSKQIDADAVFRMVINCFPERPQWGLDVKAVAGARLTEDNKVSTFDTAGLSRYYAGIVAEMPLYSADEQFRIREVETKRRGEAAANVAALLKALADRDRALRLVGIGESVEARSQYRVHEGIAPAEEQSGYLKEVAGSVGDLDAANAAIVAARLALVGQCRDEVAEEVNDYLKEVTQ
jgi:hypothetical protein